MPGEIIPAEGCAFYDYEAKYTKDSGLLVPAPLTPEQTAEVRHLAIEAYRAIDAAGLGRVDFLFDPEACHSRGYMLMVVKPGIVLISLTCHVPATRSSRKSTRPRPHASIAR